MSGWQVKRAIGVCLLCGMVGGCWGPGKPRIRVGALPYPSLLYREADPASLGRHQYDLLPSALGGWEIDRGIIYTREAGFVDVAHVRDTADWTRYCHQRIRSAVDAGHEEVRIGGPDLTTYFITVHYPSDWAELAASDRDEVALVMAQEMGYLMSVWHEVVTWFGYRTTVLFSERRSAFAYDDIVAHVVGLRVADRALRDEADGYDYDTAVTLALDRELRDLGALPPRETRRAMKAVKGTWWERGRLLKRHARVGFSDDAVSAWLIPEFSEGRRRREWPLPTLRDVRGRDFSGIYTVRFRSSILEAGRIQSALDDRPRYLTRDHMPQLMEAVREQIRRVDGPWAVE